MDLLCLEDLDERALELDDPLAELEQDVVHMLFETYGSNPDAPTRGIGLEDALSGPFDPSLLHRIENQLAEDDRITAVSAKLVDEGEGRSRLDIAIEASEGELAISYAIDATGAVTRVRT